MILVVTGCANNNSNNNANNKPKGLEWTSYSYVSSACFGEVCYEIVKLSDENCSLESNCDSKKNYEVVLKAGTGEFWSNSDINSEDFGKGGVNFNSTAKEYTIRNDSKYTKIEGLDYYLSLDIKDGLQAIKITKEK